MRITPKRAGKLLTLCALAAAFAAAPGSASARVITQNSSNEIDVPNSGACLQQADPPVYTFQNSYYRLFEIPSGQGAFTVSSVTFGIEYADDGKFITGEGQPITVKLYALQKSFLLKNLQLLGSTTVTVQDDESETLRTVPVTGTIADPATTQLVAEVRSEEDPIRRTLFYIGSNSEPEDAVSWVSAPDCFFDQPTPVSNLVATQMSIVLFVEGTFPGDLPAPPPVPRDDNPQPSCKTKKKGKGKGRKRAAIAKKKHGKKKKKKCGAKRRHKHKH